MTSTDTRRPAPPAPRPSTARRVGWVLMTFFAVALCGLASPYLSGDPDAFLPQQRAVYLAHRVPLLLHVAGSVVALAVGPLQFVRRLRARRPAVHRTLGRLYVGAVLAGATGGLLLAPTALTGPLTGLAFGLLAVVTLATTTAAVVTIRQRRVQRHQVWMTRSYALIFTGVSFRLGLAVLPLAGLDFTAAYRVSAWISWPVNLLVAEALLRRRRRVGR